MRRAATASAVMFLLLAAAPLRAGDGAWTITPGLGHDQFAQTYFLDDTTAITSDSLAHLKRTLEALKESYVSAELGYDRPWLHASNTVYLTSAARRDIAFGRARLRRGAFTIDLGGRFEWRGQDNRDTLSSAFTYWRADATPRVRLSDRWSLLARSDWEATAYRRDGPLAPGNHRRRLRAGFEYVGDGLESIEALVGVSRRVVPDSTRLSYTEHLAQVDLAGWSVGLSRWLATFLYSRRAFDTDSLGDDHQRWEALLGTTLDWSDRWRSNLNFDWELVKYQYEDEVRYDVQDGELRLSQRYAPAAVIFAGLAGEWHWERAVHSSFAANNYNELSLGPTCEWDPHPGLWSEISAAWGKRDYAGASTTYDNYRFGRIELQADGDVWGRLSMSASVTYEKENHDDPSRDADYVYFLLSARVPFRF